MSFPDDVDPTLPLEDGTALEPIAFAVEPGGRLQLHYQHSGREIMRRVFSSGEEELYIDGKPQARVSHAFALPDADPNLN